MAPNVLLIHIRSVVSTLDDSCIFALEYDSAPDDEGIWQMRVLAKANADQEGVVPDGHSQLKTLTLSSFRML